MLSIFEHYPGQFSVDFSQITFAIYNYTFEMILKKNVCFKIIHSQLNYLQSGSLKNLLVYFGLHFRSFSCEKFFLKLEIEIKNHSRMFFLNMILKTTIDWFSSLRWWCSYLELSTSAYSQWSSFSEFNCEMFQFNVWIFEKKMKLMF